MAVQRVERMVVTMVFWMAGSSVALTAVQKVDTLVSQKVVCWVVERVGKWDDSLVVMRAA
jgi:hypothetical protein